MYTNGQVGDTLKMHMKIIKCFTGHQYDVALSAHHVLPSLLKNWNFKTDVNNIVVILKKLIVDAHDAVSQVLVKVLKKCNSLDQLKFYLQLVQALKLEKIDINPTVAEHILNGLRSKEPSPILKEIESLICQFEGTSIESSAIPHPVCSPFSMRVSQSTF
uniref:Uncharacterized protein n=1 Tax=Photinus pyralis TaxID=7054 RepID=A0A1Y1KU04_PHOPY